MDLKEIKKIYDVVRGEFSCAINLRQEEVGGALMALDKFYGLIKATEEMDHYSTEELEFDVFRKAYPGTKRGLRTEFANFRKKHKDWREVIPRLLPAVKAQIVHRSRLKARNEFVPMWKNLPTWINNRCWEEEFGADQNVTPSTEDPRYEMSDDLKMIKAKMEDMKRATTGPRTTSTN